jgi:phosphoglycerol transferase MdoB-like AlkP superfamily enzyme
VNPRGDRLLTELTIRALRELRPKLIMVNYNDPDYVHWGNLTHYTRGIAIIDEGIKQILAAVEADEHYRDNTIFVIVPDCGRDNNQFAAVPCQHHFGSRSSHEIFALLFGPGIDRGVVVDRRVSQINVAATVGKLMGFKTQFAQGPVLSEAFA